MSDSSYAYGASSTKNPFRYALALWRFMRSKTDDDVVSEVAIIELGFARSRFGRRLARWEDTIKVLEQEPKAQKALAEQALMGPIDLDKLAQCQFGTLGHTFAEHCRNRGINPNLVDIPLEEESDWLLNHMYQTHDIWHVITGWANDEIGEIGLGGFYCAQLKSPPFFIFLFALIMLKKVWRKEEGIDEFMRAFYSGYQMGLSADLLFGVNWSHYWDTPLAELRGELGVDSREATHYGQGILAEAA